MGQAPPKLTSAPASRKSMQWNGRSYAAIDLGTKQLPSADRQNLGGWLWWSMPFRASMRLGEGWPHRGTFLRRLWTGRFGLERLRGQTALPAGDAGALGWRPGMPPPHPTARGIRCAGKRKPASRSISSRRGKRRGWRCSAAYALLGAGRRTGAISTMVAALPSWCWWRTAAAPRRIMDWSASRGACSFHRDGGCREQPPGTPAREAHLRIRARVAEAIAPLFAIVCR